ncbi:MAG: hypothetical protein GYB67_08790 [Chloroflexi bacterium]|nr:hypothetical protein [Chloroflexota bacterium]
MLQSTPRRSWRVGHCLLVLSTILMAAACSPASQSQQQPTARNRIVYGLTLQPSGFDPHIHASAELGIPLRQVYDTLVYRDPQTQVFVPGLATEWAISPDGLTYTFRLRAGITFHDGTPFNAEAVAANLDRIMNPDTASQRAAFLLGPYLGYEIVDELTIRLILSSPYSPLLDALSQVYLGIASPAALGQFSNQRYQFNQVGTGPFAFVEYVPGDRLVIRRYEDYAWGPPFYDLPGLLSVDEVEFRFFTEPATRATALESGEADIMGELSPIDASFLTANSAIQILPVAAPGQPLQFLMNTQRFPTDDLRVRQALIMATNREAIIDAVFRRFSPLAWGPLSRNMVYAYRELQDLYSFDPAQARTLLEAAGLQDADENGFLDLNGVEIEVNIVAPSWGMIPEVAQLLQDQWRDAGLRVVIDPVPSLNLLLEAVASGEYNLVAFYEFGLDPVFLNRYFISSAPNNWLGYANSALDELLIQATQIVDPNERFVRYAQAQQIIMQDALILPIRDYVNLNGARTSIQNLSFDAYGWFPILNNVIVNPN